ncbi:MAG: hypothetical protein FWC00_04665 [Firmicutes bacterium]|nr:hypothetical protein [Bacillota bacterium]
MITKVIVDENGKVLELPNGFYLPEGGGAIQRVKPVYQEEYSATVAYTADMGIMGTEEHPGRLDPTKSILFLDEIDKLDPALISFLEQISSDTEGLEKHFGFKNKATLLKYGERDGGVGYPVVDYSGMVKLYPEWFAIDTSRIITNFNELPEEKGLLSELLQKPNSHIEGARSWIGEPTTFERVMDEEKTERARETALRSLDGCYRGTERKRGCELKELFKESELVRTVGGLVYLRRGRKVVHPNELPKLKTQKILTISEREDLFRV